MKLGFDRLKGRMATVWVVQNVLIAGFQFNNAIMRCLRSPPPLLSYCSRFYFWFLFTSNLGFVVPRGERRQRGVKLS